MVPSDPQTPAWTSDRMLRSRPNIEIRPAPGPLSWMRKFSPPARRGTWGWDRERLHRIVTRRNSSRSRGFRLFCDLRNAFCADRLSDTRGGGECATAGDDFARHWETASAGVGPAMQALALTSCRMLAASAIEAIGSQWAALLPGRRTAAPATDPLVTANHAHLKLRSAFAHFRRNFPPASAFWER